MKKHIKIMKKTSEIAPFNLKQPLTKSCYKRFIFKISYLNRKIRKNKEFESFGQYSLLLSIN